MMAANQYVFSNKVQNTLNDLKEITGLIDEEEILCKATDLFSLAVKALQKDEKILILNREGEVSQLQLF